MTMDQPHYPTTAQKVAGQLFRSTPTQRFGAFGGQPRPSLYESQYKYGNYSNAGLTYPSQMTCDLSVVKYSVSPVFAQAPAEKGFAGFAIDFLMGGVSAAVSKTAAARCLKQLLLLLSV